MISRKWFGYLFPGDRLRVSINTTSNIISPIPMFKTQACLIVLLVNPAAGTGRNRNCRSSFLSLSNFLQCLTRRPYSNRKFVTILCFIKPLSHHSYCVTSTNSPTIFSPDLPVLSHADSIDNRHSTGSSPERDPFGRWGHRFHANDQLSLPFSEQLWIIACLQLVTRFRPHFYGMHPATGLRWNSALRKVRNCSANYSSLVSSTNELVPVV